ncbi:MAG: carotenoid biosynthesis protein [Bacteroidota bacterium]
MPTKSKINTPRSLVTSSSKQSLWTSHERNTSLFLLSMYVAGVVGLALPIHEDFVLLTPFNLLVSLALVLWHHPSKNLAVYGFVAICFVVGFFVELMGVQTGLIFGEYSYGEALGWKIGGTPLLIGVNWALLVYASAALVNALFSGGHWFVKSVLGALAMTLLDVLIEPVAMEIGFWHWVENEVPLQNYIAWFLVALPLHGCFHLLLGKPNNKVAIVLFILQCSFFGILAVLL